MKILISTAVIVSVSAAAILIWVRPPTSPQQTHAASSVPLVSHQQPTATDLFHLPVATNQVAKNTSSVSSSALKNLLDPLLKEQQFESQIFDLKKQNDRNAAQVLLGAAIALSTSPRLGERLDDIINALGQITNPEAALFLAQALLERDELYGTETEQKMIVRAMTFAVQNSSDPIEIGRQLYVEYQKNQNPVTEQRLLDMGQSDFMARMWQQGQAIPENNIDRIELAILGSSDPHMIDAFIKLTNTANPVQTEQLLSLSASWAAEHANDAASSMLLDYASRTDLSAQQQAMIKNLLENSTLPQAESVLQKYNATHPTSIVTLKQESSS